MLLSKSDAKLYFELKDSLFSFAVANFLKNELNQYQNKSITFEEITVFVGNKIFDKNCNEIIDAFIKSNPQKFPREALDIAASWKNYVKGPFCLAEHQKDFSIFISIGEFVLPYGVIGLTDPIANLCSFPLPTIVNTILLPFKDSIIHSGMLSIHSEFPPKEYIKMKKETDKILASTPIIKNMDHQKIKYTISYDPLENKQFPIPDQLKEKLPPVLKSKPGDAIEALLSLIEEYPNVPYLYNQLGITYQNNGEHRCVNLVITLAHSLFPDYLFTKCAFASLCISKGMLNKIPEIFGNKFNLKSLYPTRDIFHISESTVFSSLMGRYFAALGEFNTANLYLNILIDTLDQNAPQIIDLKKFIAQKKKNHNKQKSSLKI